MIKELKDSLEFSKAQGPEGMTQRRKEGLTEEVTSEQSLPKRAIVLQRKEGKHVPSGEIVYTKVWAGKSLTHIQD